MSARAVIIFADGTTMVFDNLGEQIAECQGCILDVEIVKNLNKYCNEDTEFYKGDWTHKTRKSLNWNFKQWFKKKKISETSEKTIKITKFNNNKFSKEDPLYNECYRYNFINFEELINELSMIIPSRVINRAQVCKMLNEGQRIVTMNFTYFLKQEGKS